MTRFTQERDEEAVRATIRPPEPAPPAVSPGSMAWASAVGNQAVARLARQADLEAIEAEAEAIAVEEAPAGPDEEIAATIEELPEDVLPE